jgi:hypothetical protein
MSSEISNKSSVGTKITKQDDKTLLKMINNLSENKKNALIAFLGVGVGAAGTVATNKAIKYHKNKSNKQSGGARLGDFLPNIPYFNPAAAAGTEAPAAPAAGTEAAGTEAPATAETAEAEAAVAEELKKIAIKAKAAMPEAEAVAAKAEAAAAAALTESRFDKFKHFMNDHWQNVKSVELINLFAGLGLGTLVITGATMATKVYSLNNQTIPKETIYNTLIKKIDNMRKNKNPAEIALVSAFMASAALSLGSLSKIGLDKYVEHKHKVEDAKQKTVFALAPDENKNVNTFEDRKIQETHDFINSGGNGNDEMYKAKYIKYKTKYLNLVKNN